jgi:hypothetical protein
LNVCGMFPGEDEQTHAFPRCSVPSTDHKHAVNWWGDTTSR